ncbi:MAG: hypothetical protein HY234_16040 [Acidobacteria bacterium]|nr:hypothetical protein [Acidobacteriota bacterium]MBI3664547.1 hypothetical protein [Acidobacteriota bacterium]
MRKENAAFLVLVLTSAIALLRDISVLFRYPVAVGLDGYYYVQQVNSVLGGGKLYYPTWAPLVIYFLAPLSRIAGVVPGIKIASLFFHLFLCLGVYAVVAEALGSRWFGVLAYGIAASSALHFYFVGEFLRETAALALLAWGCCSLLKAATGERRRRDWLLLSLLLFLAAFFSHISALLYLCLGVLLWCLLRVLICTASSRMARWLTFVSVLVLWSLPCLLANQRLLTLPEWLGSEFLPRPQSPIGGIGWAEKVVALVAVPTYAAISISRRTYLKNTAAFYTASISAIACAILTLNPFLNYSIGTVGLTGRLGNLVHLYVAVLIPAVISSFRQSKLSVAHSFAAIPVISLLALAALEPLPRGLRPDYLWDRQQLIVQLPRVRTCLEPHSIVLAPHGDQFVFTATLGVPSQWEWPSDAGRWRVLWFLRRVSGDLLNPSMTIVTGDERLANVLVKDGDLRIALKSFQTNQREYLFRNNPHLYAALHGISHAPFLVRHREL